MRWLGRTSRSDKVKPNACVERTGAQPVARAEKPETWVVYEMKINGKMSGMAAVCEQGEWEAMERLQPGQHLLIKAGIPSEGAAEQLARRGVASAVVEAPRP